MLRTSDTVARLGGDEFGILLVEDHAEPAVEQVCLRIFDNFAAAVSCGNTDVNARLCIGIAEYPLHGIIAEDLYKCADRALYDAKRAGGGTHRRCPHQTREEQVRMG